MRAHGWLLAVAFVLGAGAALPAQAADGSRPVARDGNVVLTAGDQGSNLCIGISVDAEPGSGACGDAAVGIVVPPSTTARGARYVGVAAAARAARVEVRRAGRIVGKARTVAGTRYAGKAAGTVRFALVRLARGTPAPGLRVHLLDATGALIEVLDAGRERVIARKTLLSGRAGRRTWSLVEERVSELAPLAGDLAHERLSRCVTTSVSEIGGGGGGGISSGARACTSGSPGDEVALDDQQASREDRCAPDFRLLHGVVAAAVRRVTVTLGSGRRRSASTVSLAGATRRAYGIVIAAGDAVRSVALQPSSGPARLLTLARAPLVVDCALRPSGVVVTGDEVTSSADPPAVTPAGPVASIAGSPGLRVADGPGDTLCIAAGERPFTASGCDLVAPLPASPLGVFDRASDPPVAAFAAPASVATIRLSGDKVVLDLPTVAAAGYAGRYAGFVRVASATLPRGVDFTRVDALDAQGHSLLEDGPAASGWTAYAPLADASSGASRRVAGRPGAPSLWQTPLRVGDRTVRCLALTGGAPPDDAEACGATRSDVTVLLDAPCASHRLTVAVAAGATTRVLADVGGSARRAVRLRAGAGLVTLSPGTGLRALTFARTGATRRIALDAPPGARQCGWRAAPLILPR